MLRSNPLIGLALPSPLWAALQELLGHGVLVGAVPVLGLLRRARVMTTELLARPRALAPAAVWLPLSVVSEPG